MKTYTAKSVSGSRTNEEAEALCIRAHKLWESGKPRLAFRAMYQAAQMGDIGAQLNVGYMLDTGTGTRGDRNAAMCWYKKAYRRGNSSAAHNIGTIYRDDKQPTRALYWFNRAITLNGGDDGDASLEIANLYLKLLRDEPSAIVHLKRATRSKNITRDSVESAKRLLKELTRTRS